MIFKKVFLKKIMDQVFEVIDVCMTINHIIKGIINIYVNLIITNYKNTSLKLRNYMNYIT